MKRATLKNWIIINTKCYLHCTFAVLKRNHRTQTMHRSDSTFHAVCEHEIKYCVLAEKCVHQHYINTKKDAHKATRSHTHNSLNEYDTFPFDSIWQESSTMCHCSYYQRSQTTYMCGCIHEHMCAHSNDMCAVVRSNHRSSSPQI